MLSTPTEFPQVGSYALYRIDGRTQLARIQKRHDDGRALISLPLVPDVATGSLTVPIGELIDGTPLTEAERVELQRLNSELLQPKRHTRAKRDRADALRTRDIHSGVMAAMITRVPVPSRRGSIRDLAA